MKKFIRIDNLYSLAESPPPSLQRYSESKNLYSSLNYSGYYMKAGISVINDKKRSLLRVPKTLISKHPDFIESQENLPKSIETPNLGSPFPTTTPKNPNSLKLDSKSSSTCKSARMAIISSSRYRENPNKENLKLALEAISKLPPIQKELKKETFAQESPQKSDIEKLIESQASGRLSKFHPKLTKIKNLEQLKIDSRISKSRLDDNASQNSDPSPVRKAKQTSPERRGNSQKFLNCKKKKESFLSLLKKIQNPREAETQQSPSSSSDDCENWPKNFDYQKESLRILKDTSTFATKIMKNIRLARRKDF